MLIEGFSSKEWLAISDLITEHCPDNPLLNKLIEQIEDKTNLFKELEEFLILNKFNPIFFPSRHEIEKISGGHGLLKRCGFYKTSEGTGLIQFKKDYQKYILKKYEIKKKENRSTNNLKKFNDPFYCMESWGGGRPFHTTGGRQ